MATLFCSVDWEKVVSVLAALLTPLIALLAAYIAWQQHKTNRRQVRLALFEKRYAVFNSAATLIAGVLQRAQADMNDIRNFDVGTKDTEFLFDTDIQDYLNDVRTHAVNLMALGPGPQPEPAARTALLNWFSGQIGVARNNFGKYMAFKEDS